LPPILESLLLALIAGITIPFGALLASVEHFHNKWIANEFQHSVIAFGGGILLAAIALVFVPKGMEELSLTLVIIGFTGGSLVFFFIDRLLENKGGSFSQLLAMLLDFIPEAMALGALITNEYKTALLLTILIALQNLPEAFNAYCEIKGSGSFTKKKIIGSFFGLMLIGPLSAVLGTQFLTNSQALLAGIMIFSSGGILYLIFQDIAPKVPLEKAWAPPLGAVGGFLLGIIAHMLLKG